MGLCQGPARAGCVAQEVPLAGLEGWGLSLLSVLQAAPEKTLELPRLLVLLVLLTQLQLTLLLALLLLLLLWSVDLCFWALLGHAVLVTQGRLSSCLPVMAHLPSLESECPWEQAGRLCLLCSDGGMLRVLRDQLDGDPERWA